MPKAKKKKKTSKSKGKAVNALASLEQYQLVPVAKLRKAPWNYKEDDDEQSKKLAANIKRNKQVVNIIVREMPDGTLEVVDGNHRVDAFHEAGMKMAVAFNLGKVPVTTAKRMAMEINETRFKSDHVKMAELVQELVDKHGLDDLETTMPFSREDLEGYMNLLSFDLDALRNKKLGEITNPMEQEGFLRFSLTEKDLAMWHRLKRAFQGITADDEEVFRIVCRDYLKRIGKKKKTKTT